MIRRAASFIFTITVVVMVWPLAIAATATELLFCIGPEGDEL